MVADTPPYSTVRSLTAPDMQMVVVPPTSTSATTAMAKVSFMAPPVTTVQPGIQAQKLNSSELLRQKDFQSGFRKIRVN
jgi:hypothetical protein